MSEPTYYVVFSGREMRIIPAMFVTTDLAEAEQVRQALIDRGEAAAIVDSAAQSPVEWLRNPKGR